MPRGETIILLGPEYGRHIKTGAGYENPLDAGVARIDIMGARPMLPVWCTGLMVFRNTFSLCCR